VGVGEGVLEAVAVGTLVGLVVATALVALVAPGVAEVVEALVACAWGEGVVPSAVRGVGAPGAGV
jgi:hypothetical protein